MSEDIATVRAFVYLVLAFVNAEWEYSAYSCHCTASDAHAPSSSSRFPFKFGDYVVMAASTLKMPVGNLDFSYYYFFMSA